ncbi:hypothetical protein GOODEAATRI_017380 [Goodea atripinnis]|uniref:Uncharacterized protein n=1 Tax=Goodea atripinnis TaxID=208336 RepID=A0ABV0PYS2_9TELE
MTSNGVGYSGPLDQDDWCLSSEVFQEPWTRKDLGVDPDLSSVVLVGLNVVWASISMPLLGGFPLASPWEETEKRLGPCGCLVWKCLGFLHEDLEIITEEKGVWVSVLIDQIWSI